MCLRELVQPRRPNGRRKQEVQENTIDLREDDPEIVGQLLAFLYTGNYTTPSLARPGTDDSQTSEGSGTVSELVVFNKIRQHILVYQAADKFGIPNLMQQAWDNIKVDCHEDSTGLVLPHHEEILRLVFECTTQRDMRRRPYMIIRTLDCHAAGVSTEEIEKVMVEHEPMAWAAGIRRGCWQCNPKRADAV